MVEISAADAQDEIDALQAGLMAIEARVSALETTGQPMLTNGPLPPGPAERIMTLLAQSSPLSTESK